MFSEIIVPLLAFVIVLVLCYYTTKFLGRKLTGGRKNRTMRIVETLSLGLDRCLYLIKVGKKYFLFHSSKKGLELVSEIEVEERPEGDSQEAEGTAGNFDFKRIFEMYSGLGRKMPPNREKHDENSKPETSTILKSVKRLQKINGNKE